MGRSHSEDKKYIYAAMIQYLCPKMPGSGASERRAKPPASAGAKLPEQGPGGSSAICNPAVVLRAAPKTPSLPPKALTTLKTGGAMSE